MSPSRMAARISGVVSAWYFTFGGELTVTVDSFSILFHFVFL